MLIEVNEWTKITIGTAGKGLQAIDVFYSKFTFSHDVDKMVHFGIAVFAKANAKRDLCNRRILVFQSFHISVKKGVLIFRIFPPKFLLVTENFGLIF